jgi:hypothetical protein
MRRYPIFGLAAPTPVPGNPEPALMDQDQRTLYTSKEFSIG